MYLGIRPEGVALTPSQAKLLDDEFFLADPLGHFTARIEMLLNKEVEKPTRETHPDFFTALGLKGFDAMPTPAATRRDAQVAVDALVLRHQCAEALERFLYAVTAARPKGADAASTWMAVAESPPSLADVAAATKQAFDADQQMLFKLLYPIGTVITEDAAAAASTALAWVNHATHLLLYDELSVNGAYNKLKHGLAVTTRDDVRVELITTQPDHDGTVPLSSFGEGRSIPIFDRPLLTYLARPRVRRNEPKQGIEAISLRVDVATILAETWMMANTYATLFHVAALKHFGADVPSGIAPPPVRIVGRTPERMLRNHPLGYRTPVTFPPDGTTAPRRSGVFFHDAFIPMDVDFGSRRSGRVVGD